MISSGYDQLARQLRDFAGELHKLGFAAAASKLEHAEKFRISPPTEFLAESLSALDDVIDSMSQSLNPVVDEMGKVADAIEKALVRSGFFPSRRK